MPATPRRFSAVSLGLEATSSHASTLRQRMSSNSQSSIACWKFILSPP